MASGLTKSYKKKTVVRDVSLEINSGEIIGLLGPNGAGKTTTFYMIVGLVRCDAGSIEIDDLDITHYPMYRRAWEGINYLPQESSIFQKLTVRQNIRLILEQMKYSSQERKKREDELLSDLGIENIATNLAYTLSGGERRRVEIARALASHPDFILLDEPFAGVDPLAIDDIKNIIRQLKDRGIGILITDHNVSETLAITDRAYIIIEGKIFRHGTSEELAHDSEVQKTYLGEDYVKACPECGHVLAKHMM